MKKDIHPAYYPNAKITCACGHVFTIGATKQSMEVEICSQCHPLYTGKEKLVDTAGRVEKFQAKLKKSAYAQAAHATVKKKMARTQKQAIKSEKRQRVTHTPKPLHEK